MEIYNQGIENLRKAIILNAIKDYKDSECFNKECEKFFHSDWFDLLSGGIDGQAVIDAAKLQYRYLKWRIETGCKKCKDKECIHFNGQHYTAVEKGELFCKKKEGK